MGNVTGDGDCICDSGVRNIKHLGAGWHQIEMDLADEDGNVVQLNCGSVPATISSKRLPGEGWSDAYRHISVSQIVNSVVDVYISDRDCKPVDEYFTFKVTGHP